MFNIPRKIRFSSAAIQKSTIFACDKTWDFFPMWEKFWEGNIENSALGKQLKPFLLTTFPFKKIISCVFFRYFDYWLPLTDVFNKRSELTTLEKEKAVDIFLPKHANVMAIFFDQQFAHDIQIYPASEMVFSLDIFSPGGQMSEAKNLWELDKNGQKPNKAPFFDGRIGRSGIGPKWQGVWYWAGMAGKAGLISGRNGRFALGPEWQVWHALACGRNGSSLEVVTEVCFVYDEQLFLYPRACAVMAFLPFFPYKGREALKCCLIQEKTFPILTLHIQTLTRHFNTKTLWAIL